MFKKESMTTTHEQAIIKMLEEFVSNPSYSLVPESHYYGNDMRNGKREDYISFLSNVSPSDINRNTFNKINNNEANGYLSMADRDHQISEVTVSRILRLQEADIVELKRNIEWEEIFRSYIMSTMTISKEVLHHEE